MLRFLILERLLCKDLEGETLNILKREKEFWSITRVFVRLCIAVIRHTVFFFKLQNAWQSQQVFIPQPTCYLITSNKRQQQMQPGCGQAGYCQTAICDVTFGIDPVVVWWMQRVPTQWERGPTLHSTYKKAFRRETKHSHCVATSFPKLHWDTIIFGAVGNAQRRATNLRTRHTFAR